MVGAIYGGEDIEVGGIERTTAIQYAQSLWLSRCSLGVGHSNSKQCIIEEMVLEENRGVERSCAALWWGACTSDARRCTMLTIEGLLPSALQTCPAININE